MKNVIRAAALTGAIALALAACGSAPTTGGSTSSAAASGAANSSFKGCIVSDSGGFNDKSFNESGFQGLKDAAGKLGIQTASAESKTDDAYTPNIQNMLSQNCNIIVTVGFKLSTATGDAAKANTKTKFALVDAQPTDAQGKALTLDNVKPLEFDTAQAAYLAGYLAAGMSKTGKVGTYGGLKIPTVTVFMDGFADGIAKYNQVKGKNVQLIGWDKAKQDGLFDGGNSPFDPGSGKANADSLVAAGADILLPVAGGAALDALTAAKATPGTLVIWVDSDGALINPDSSSIILTSVMKLIGAAVGSAVTDAAGNKFDATPYVGTLKNNGVGIAPYHDLDSKVPSDLKSEVDQLKADIISGKITVQSANAPKAS
ncbi:MAG: BMP family ABC transporter substrate-binding protein [Cellulomonas sp. 73-145]|uniref:BMP family lipoprotein n=1 Tax=Cellulomonas sp. 73-145 TaxID=1895739 RepID=UPI000926A017|nr:BMP family ABC transporter substrate-binding protein [Cellulomonas sp. 73-145]MBN9327134.1 BMP family ABC transporter substrate-binding protein [Cellulomonas sp.]OJV56840.1 MAG: BMP family ABC transporter substrate-binding protein [Cellulomonas sp. 73-145]